MQQKSSHASDDPAFMHLLAVETPLLRESSWPDCLAGSRSQLPHSQENHAEPVVPTQEVEFLAYPESGGGASSQSYRSSPLRCSLSSGTPPSSAGVAENDGRFVQYPHQMELLGFTKQAVVLEIPRTEDSSSWYCHHLFNLNGAQWRFETKWAGKVISIHLVLLGPKGAAGIRAGFVACHVSHQEYSMQADYDLATLKVRHPTTGAWGPSYGLHERLFAAGGLHLTGKGLLPVTMLVFAKTLG